MPDCCTVDHDFLHNAPVVIVNALMEDYLLEPISERATRFTYTVAYEPRVPLSLLGPVGKFALSRNFEKASKSCAKFMTQL
jgi:hypothetical protein